MKTNDWCLTELLVIHSTTWNNLTLLTDVYKSCIYNIYMYKLDLVLNNLQYLICPKTKPNQTFYIDLVYFIFFIKVFLVVKKSLARRFSESEIASLMFIGFKFRVLLLIWLSTTIAWGSTWPCYFTCWEEEMDSYFSKGISVK